MSPRVRTIAMTAAIVLLVAAVGVVLYARGGGPVPGWLGFASSQDPLGESGAPEIVLRTLRLAGFQRAVVGDEAKTVVVRVQLQAVDTAADVQIAWQTGVAALGVAYPSATDYVVQVFEDERGLIEVAWDGERARDAIGTDDASALGAAARFTFLGPGPADDSGIRGTGGNEAESEPGVVDYIVRGLRGSPGRAIGTVPAESLAMARALRDAAPGNATALPDSAVSIDIDYSGAYLDAKNRAAKLLAGDGPIFDGADVLVEAADTMRGSAPGIPALPPGVDAGRFWAGLGLDTLKSQIGLVGASELERELQDVEPGLEGPALAGVRAAAMSALAIARAPLGTVLTGVAASATLVAKEPVSDQGRDAVLAAARDARAPESATTLEAMERDESLDVPNGGTTFGAFPLAARPSLQGSVLQYPVDGEIRQLDPEFWRGYRREDGVLFWRADDDGEVAVMDASLLGWAYSSLAAAVVNASDVGLVYQLKIAPR